MSYINFDKLKGKIANNPYEDNLIEKIQKKYQKQQRRYYQLLDEWFFECMEELGCSSKDPKVIKKYIEDYNIKVESLYNQDTQEKTYAVKGLCRSFYKTSVELWKAVLECNL